MTSLVEPEFRIVDAKIVGSELVLAIDGPVQKKFPFQGTGMILIYSNKDHQFISDPAYAREPIAISSDGQLITWLSRSESISIDTIMNYRTKACSNQFRVNRQQCKAEITSEDLVGCWSLDGQYVYLHDDGTARLKSTGRGRTHELDGTWRWSLIDSSHFKILRVDVSDEDPVTNLSFEVSRYDGKVIEASRTFQLRFMPDPLTLVALFCRTKPPRSWQHLA